MIRPHVEFARKEKFADNSMPIEACDGLWNGKPCPGVPAFLVVTKRTVSFSVMCRAHKDRYEVFARMSDDFTIEPYTMERARELQQLVKETYGDRRS